jgi:hypothetical protein
MLHGSIGSIDSIDSIGPIDSIGSIDPIGSISPCLVFSPTVCIQLYAGLLGENTNRAETPSRQESNQSV